MGQEERREADVTSFKCLPADDPRGGILIAWDQDLVTGGAVYQKTYSLSLHVTLRQSNCIVSGAHMEYGLTPP
jgi:hypothetical protein